MKQLAFLEQNQGERFDIKGWVKEVSSYILFLLSFSALIFVSLHIPLPLPFPPPYPSPSPSPTSSLFPSPALGMDRFCHASAHTTALSLPLPHSSSNRSMHPPQTLILVPQISRSNTTLVSYANHWTQMIDRRQAPRP
jgi:hypothetical protein